MSIKCPFVIDMFNLQAKLFGVPIFPWMMNTAFAALPLILIVMAKSDLYMASLLVNHIDHHSVINRSFNTVLEQFTHRMLIL